MDGDRRLRIMEWVGSETLPHEADVRAWLRRSLDPDDLEDIIQEIYAKIGGLDDSGHIRNGRAYFFTAARSAVLMQLRRARVVSIETVTKIDRLGIVSDEPSAERIVIGRRELARVTRGVVDTKSGKRKAAPRQALIMLLIRSRQFGAGAWIRTLNQTFAKMRRAVRKRTVPKSALGQLAQAPPTFRTVARSS